MHVMCGSARLYKLFGDQIERVFDAKGLNCDQLHTFTGFSSQEGKNCRAWLISNVRH